MTDDMLDLPIFRHFRRPYGLLAQIDRPLAYGSEGGRNR